MNGFSRYIGRGIAAALLIAVAAWLLFRGAVQPSNDTPPVVTPVVTPVVERPAAVPDAGADAEGVRAEVMKVTGEAQRFNAADGTWSALMVGSLLEAADRIRTLRGGSVELQVGGSDALLAIPEGAVLDVQQLSEAAHDFKLGRGRMTVDYRAREGRVVRIQGESGAVAKSNGARFTVLSTGTSVAVASERGEVELTGEGSAVKLGPGQQSVAMIGFAPSAPAPIPVDVLLKVARAANSGAKLCVALSGTVRPGTSVEADGEPVDVDAQGRFKLAVARRPGQSKVRVSAREVSGKQTQTELPCSQSEQPAEVEIQWDKQ